MQELKSKFLKEKPTTTFPLNLSVSKVKTFKDCKAKFHYLYIEKLPRKEWDFHVFGKFLHEVLENFHKARMNGSQDPDNVLMTNVYKISYENWKEKISKDQTTEARGILKKYLKILAKETPNVIGVEKEFYIDIDEKVLLNGYIDRVQIDSDGVLHVSDYKTSKDKSGHKKDHFQLMTYAFVMCLEDPSIERIRTSYVMLRHNFEYIIKEYTREEVMTMEDVFLDYYGQIINEKLYRTKTSPLCKYCDALDLCNDGKNKIGVKYGATDW